MSFVSCTSDSEVPGLKSDESENARSVISGGNWEEKPVAPVKVMAVGCGHKSPRATEASADGTEGGNDIAKGGDRGYEILLPLETTEAPVVGSKDVAVVPVHVWGELGYRTSPPKAIGAPAFNGTEGGVEVAMVYGERGYEILVPLGAT